LFSLFLDYRLLTAIPPIPKFTKEHCVIAYESIGTIGVILR